LPKDILESDPKLRNILADLAKTKIRLLDKSYKELSKVLGQTGDFEVKDKKFETDDTKEKINLNFSVKLKDSNKSYPFSIEIENNRPLITIPPQTRDELNNMNTPESKTLRSELIHIQETILDNFDDVVKSSTKRDNYLKTLEKKVDDSIGELNPLETSMAKFLMRIKYKNVK
jgi:hypothetical protein